MTDPKVGDRVLCRFDMDTTYFWAEGDVISINKHGRARVEWDDPPMHTGLMPLDALVKVASCCAAGRRRKAKQFEELWQQGNLRR